MTSIRILQAVLPLLAVLLIGLQARRERPIKLDRLWLMPGLVTLLIAVGLYFAPHPPFALADYLAMTASGASGLLFGWWRGTATVLRYDRATGRVMASQSNIAAGILAGGFLLRTMARQSLGEQSALAGDMSMLFALGMIVAMRAALWVRAEDFASVGLRKPSVTGISPPRRDSCG